MGLRRKITDALIEWKSREDRKSLIVRGARQVGKTFSILEFAKENYRSVVYVNFVDNKSTMDLFEGDLDVDSVVTRISGAMPDVDLIPYETAIILDEIQECPGARTCLKAFSKDERYDVIASGSLLGISLSVIPDIPVGQEERLWMYPMDFEEFLWALGLKDDVIDHVRTCIRDRKPLGKSIRSSLMKYLTWYMLVGGMPEAVSAFLDNHTFSGVRRIQSNIIADYEDDIAKHCIEEERLKTELCFESISRFLSKDNRRFVASTVEPDLGYRPPVSRYEYALNWLSQAGIVFECRRVSNPKMPAEESGIDIEKNPVAKADAEPTDERDDDGNPDSDNGKEENGTMGTFKLYMMDTGLLTFLYDPSIYKQILAGNMEVNRGALTENLVAGMLRSQGKKLLYFEKYREIEIDFLLVIGGRPTAVEVKSGRKRTCRSLNKAMEDYGLKGMMFDTTDIFVDDKGVEHLPIFAAAFMDCIDPQEDVRIDFGSVDELNDMFT